MLGAKQRPVKVPIKIYSQVNSPPPKEYVDVMAAYMSPNRADSRSATTPLSRNEYSDRGFKENAVEAAPETTYNTILGNANNSNVPIEYSSSSSG